MENSVETLDAFFRLFDAIKTGQSTLVTSAVISVVFQVVKPFFGFLPKWAARLLPIAFGAVSSIFGGPVFGLNPVESITAGLGGGYFAASHHQAFKGAAEALKVVKEKRRLKKERGSLISNMKDIK